MSAREKAPDGATEAGSSYTTQLTLRGFPESGRECLQPCWHHV